MSDLITPAALARDLEFVTPEQSLASLLLDEDGKAALRADLVALARSFDQDDDEGVVLDWEYRIVTATRR